MEEAGASFTQAIKLKSDSVEAHYKLGVVLQKLNRLEEAERSQRQALNVNPNFARSYDSLGAIYKELKQFEVSGKNYRKALVLKPNYSLAYCNLAKLRYSEACIEPIITNLRKAITIDPKEREYALLMHLIEAKTLCGTFKDNHDGVEYNSNKFRLSSNPVILNRAVEEALVSALYELEPTLDKKIINDARYRTRSSDFTLFDNKKPIIKKVKADLIKIIMSTVNSEVFVFDSFFNILNGDGGTTPHNHLNDLDKEIEFDLAARKYSLVYYLRVGDQTCSEPGILKLYDPDEDILPQEGMITIIPANREHSAIYNGKSDRVMIGVNFYSL